MGQLTAYQRGNRDALLGIALWLAEQATTLERTALESDAQLSASGRDSPAKRSALVYTPLYQAAAFERAAQKARSLAEAIPDDPEDPCRS